jgi:hypothetical protein
MRPEEETDLAHGQRNPFLRLLPREHADFRLRREHRTLHGDHVWGVASMIFTVTYIVKSRNLFWSDPKSKQSPPNPK